MKDMIGRKASDVETWGELDQALDSICGRFEAAITVPSTLYHYTSWAGVEGILKSRQFWATSHDCTNDPNELKTVDSLVHEVARKLEQTLDGTAALAVRLLLERYDDQPVSRFVPSYLTCFSQARDHENQWRMYGDGGRGLCLGVRVLRGETAPDGHLYVRSILPVGYSEETVRERIRQAFVDVVDVLSRLYPRFDGDRQPFVYAVTALYRIAGVANVTTKTPDWANEQEWRLLVVPRPGVDIQPLVRTSAAGEEIRYLSVAVRPPGELIALDEVTIGPSQNSEEARSRLVDLLKQFGYREGMPEWPQIRRSQ